MTRESLAANAKEIAEKERRVRELMIAQGLDALVLTAQSNFAWFTCGGENRVANGTDNGVASAVITRDGKFIVSDNIEAPRIMNEEVASQGFEFRTYNWWEGGLADEIAKVARGNVGADTLIPGTKMVGGSIVPLRYSLTTEEVERYRWLGEASEECVTETCREVRPGMTEHEIAGVLGAKLIPMGIIPNLILIATDERIGKYRHPIPTDRTLERHAMVVVGARKWGLILSMTRIVHFGALPTELRRKHDAVMEVDAALIAHTRVGTTVGAIMDEGISTYARTGFADEWHLHHQGGSTGYAGRDYRAKPGMTNSVEPNQAFAWNPSIAGTKSEDTVIALDDRVDIVSASKDWPMKAVRVGDVTVERPDILEL